MSTWQQVETFGGDQSYESPIFTFGGVATVYLNPYDAEGAAITLRIASDERSSASIHLTLEEADELAEWLKRAKDAIEKPHTTRHTYNEILRTLGYDLEERQLLLGHTSSRTTADIYGHLSIEDVARKMRAEA